MLCDPFDLIEEFFTYSEVMETKKDERIFDDDFDDEDD
jgi:hypothetical protein